LPRVVGQSSGELQDQRIQPHCSSCPCRLTPHALAKIAAVDSMVSLFVVWCVCITHELQKACTICVCLCAQAAKATLSQLKRLARALWSNPPTHGARIAAEVVGDAGMFEQWKGEVSAY
jgi:hypothetical protein